MMPTGSLHLGTLRVGDTGDGARILGENNTPVRVTADGLRDAGLQGMLVVTASGDFGTDDKVMLGEAELTRSEDGGSYSGGIAIADAAAANLAMFGVDLTYHPGGVDDLLPGEINTTVALQFDNPLNQSGLIENEVTTATINYEGFAVEAYAQGMVKAGGAAATHLRVACASTTDCSVFADCRDQFGERLFGELGVVAAGGLEVYDSDEIGEALGGGWDAGRGRCDLLSNGALEVQSMLKQGSTTSNNSVVISGGLADDLFTKTPAAVLDRTQ